jgi:hypothetical protein
MLPTEKRQATYERLCAHAREVALLTSTQSLLGWDERTKLPPLPAILAGVGFDLCPTRLGRLPGPRLCPAVYRLRRTARSDNDENERVAKRATG